MDIETGIGLFFVALAIVVFFLVRRELRAEEWHEHTSRHELEEDTKRALAERRW